MHSHVGTQASEPHRARKSLLLRILLGSVAALLLGGIVFLGWALTPYRADASAQAAMVSDEIVTVTDDAGLISFVSAGERSNVGLVLYPGGRVEAEAYAPLARRIAEEGHLVVVPRVPLNLAVFGIDRAGRAIEAYPQVSTWVVGGHSLGGAMAAEYAARRPSMVSGLLLLGAYPGSSTDLSSTGLAVLTVHASEDGLVDGSEITDGQRRLPPGSRVVSVLGGNHAGFGAYGRQRGDGVSILPDGVQTEFVARYATGLLDGLAGR